MDAITSRYGYGGCCRAFTRAMSYTVTFFALRPSLDEVIVTMHRVEKGALAAYTSTPGVALAAARTVKGEPRADGFRVADKDGRVVLDYVDWPGRG